MLEHLTHEDSEALIGFLTEGHDRFKREGRECVADFLDHVIAEVAAADAREVAELAAFEQDVEAMAHGTSEDAEVLGDPKSEEEAEELQERSR